MLGGWDVSSREKRWSWCAGVARKEAIWQTWDCDSYKGFLTRLALGWHLQTWISIVLSPFYNREGWSIVPKLFEYMIGFMLSTCFPFGSLEYWYVLGRECLHDQSQTKTGMESSVSFFGRQQFTCGVTMWCIIMHVLWDSTGGGLLEAHAWFLLDFTSCAFSLCWCCLVSFHDNKL